MEKIKKYLNTDCYKNIGCYFTAVSAVLAFVAGLVYAGAFKQEFLTGYYTAAVVVLPIISLVLTVLLAAFKPTANIAPIASWGLSLITFLTFAGTSYMYLSGVFYNGVSAEAFALIDGSYLFIAIALLVSAILGNVALWLKQRETTEVKTEEVNA